jgi:5-amino-6-(5-phospho-D-ribitylamino)uracil phosphatase
MQKYLIALDLDGTLLKDDKTISERSKQAIQKTKEQGHHVVISTGRPFRASEVYYKELQLDSPIVNFNGAYVHHPLDKSWAIQHTPLDVDIAKNIIQECREIGIKNVLAEVIDDVYIHYHDESLNHIFQMGNPTIYMGDPLETLQENPTCLLIDADEEEVEKVRQHLSDVHAEIIDHRRWAAPWHVIEIVRTGMNKAVGLQQVAKHYNIPPERIIAFGDEDNDFEMIKYAGHGIAMGNAIDELKNMANDVTLTNEEDGIAVYLEKLLKL